MASSKRMRPNGSFSMLFNQNLAGPGFAAMIGDNEIKATGTISEYFADEIDLYLKDSDRKLFTNQRRNL